MNFNFLLLFHINWTLPVKFLLWANPYFFSRGIRTIANFKRYSKQFLYICCIYFENSRAEPRRGSVTKWHPLHTHTHTGSAHAYYTKEVHHFWFVDKHAAIYSVLTSPRRDKLMFKKAVGGRYHFVSMITVPLVDLVV